MSLLHALLNLVPLDRLPRTGWILAGIPEPESVAAHSHGTALVALALGPRVEPPLDVDRVCALCTVHDLPEVLLGDVPKAGAECLPDGAKAEAEERAADSVIAPLSNHARELFAEYVARESREARFARLCDKLHLGVRLLAYRRAGLGELASFEATIAALDASEFAPAEALLAEIRAGLEERRP